MVEEELIQNEHYNHMNYPNLPIVLNKNFNFNFTIKKRKKTTQPQETRSAIEMALIRRG